MSEITCGACGASKAPHTCGICAKTVCKSCLEYVDTEAFSFSEAPTHLRQGSYCTACFDEQVVPAQARYDELMEKAKDVYFLTRAYPGFVPVLKRHKKRVSVAECEDRRETILRLAFQAAELGFNAIIEADVDSAKVRLGGKHKGSYQTSTWAGSAVPALIDAVQLERLSLRRL
jgi:hypothetical protein